MNLLYQDDDILVGETTAERQDGSSYKITCVETATETGAIVILHTTLRGSRYLGVVRQNRPVVDLIDSMEFVRGSTNDLSAEEALREVTEETGIIASPEDLRPIGSLRPDTGLLTTTVGVWTLYVPADTMQSVDHEEWESGARTEWLTKAEFLGHVGHGHITCGMTLAAFALAEAGSHLPEMW